MPDSIARGSRLLGVIEAAELLGMTRQGFKDAGQPEPDIWIGDTRGWTPETLREWDRTRPRRRTITDEKRARIVQMHREGYSIAQTAEECGVSKASVIRIRAAEKQ
ncbi:MULTISPECIES: helix-turn-helix domain-containing protein [Kocuria]|uniref:helix-turn-helix domain-containing protein n=1 Tax=Kocuria TaxID=57493 RepID=UPI000A756F84|nr:MULTISPECIES: helix-turn-helix domain-containing protein [Kocuria]